jgi:hypothetical protein
MTMAFMVQKISPPNNPNNGEKYKPEQDHSSLGACPFMAQSGHADRRISLRFWRKSADAALL